MHCAADNCRVVINLAGRFAVRAVDGSEITPKGAKTQGLLALLATSPDFRRNRRWLEDKLWSDRCAAQASASLRQALAELRRCLGVHVGIITADRQTVGLQADLVHLRGVTGAEQEFLEGIDVRDPEFEAWLRCERTSRQPPEWAPDCLPPRSADPFLPAVRRAAEPSQVVVIEGAQKGPGALATLEELFVDCVALSLREALGIIVLTRPPKRALPRSVTLQVQAVPTETGRQVLRARAVEHESGGLIWSGRSTPMPAGRWPDESELIAFAAQVVEVLGDALTLRPANNRMTDTLSLQRLAVRKIWSMDPVRLVEADTLLALTDEMEPRGLVAAWRAQLRVFQMIEHHSTDRQILREEAMALSRQALERDPNNSMVLAVVAYARNALDGNPAASFELAQRSVRLNPGNPMAWDCLSISKLCAGQLSEAHAIAQRVQRMGAITPNKFWWDMGLCITAAVTRQERLALSIAEKVHAQAPQFRAALRYVVALNAGREAAGAALSAAGRLRELEPDFSLETLAMDPAYPVGALRSAGLLRPDRIMAING